MSPLTLHSLLSELLSREGSDLHLAAGAPPSARVHGELAPLDYPALTPEDTAALALSALTPEQRSRFQETREIDFSFAIEGLCRFRGNVFHQKGAVGAVFRAIPFRIPTFDALGLPSVIARLCRRPRGLVLVTGPTGSGKSTTLAAMLDAINQSMAGHILTIEDPIEFIHNHRRSLVNQREVGSDTPGFGPALRVALRQDPDVVLIGEMRDLETVEAALRIAETGHLTFATLHTNSAAATVHRIVDVFPAHQQPQIRAQLSMVLEGVLCQSLLPRLGGGRCLAMEILIPNPAVRTLIREDKIHQIYSAMQSGQEKSGMQTFNQSLVALVAAGALAAEEAVNASSLPDELHAMLQRRTGAGA